MNATAWGSHLAPTQQRQQWQAAAAAAANGTAEAGTNAGGSPVKSPGAGISKGPAKAALADSAELLQPLLAPADGGDGGDLESGHSAAAEAAAAEAAAEAAAAAEEAAEDAALRKSETVRRGGCGRVYDRHLAPAGLVHALARLRAGQAALRPVRLSLHPASHPLARSSRRP